MQKYKENMKFPNTKKTISEPPRIIAHVRQCRKLSETGNSQADGLFCPRHICHDEVGKWVKPSVYTLH